MEEGEVCLLLSGRWTLAARSQWCMAGGMQQHADTRTHDTALLICSREAASAAPSPQARCWGAALAGTAGACVQSQRLASEVYASRPMCTPHVRSLRFASDVHASRPMSTPRVRCPCFTSEVYASRPMSVPRVRCPRLASEFYASRPKSMLHVRCPCLMSDVCASRLMSTPRVRSLSLTSNVRASCLKSVPRVWSPCLASDVHASRLISTPRVRSPRPIDILPRRLHLTCGRAPPDNSLLSPRHPSSGLLIPRQDAFLCCAGYL